MPTCKNCSKPFEHDEASLAFLARVSPVLGGRTIPIPPPKLCPECRLRRRLVFRNQIHIYTRLSSLSRQKIFSAYPEEAPVVAYGRDEWWADDWDPEDYGREFDFSRPFFEQWQEFALTVPHLARSCLNEENCDYCNNVTGTKDCYLVFNSSRSRECWYCENVFRSVDCMDCTHSPDSELCYGCVGCSNCYSVQGSYFCAGCRDSVFLFHCRNCSNCFGCVNLNRAEYCIFNKQLTKTDYEAFITKARLDSFASRAEWERKAQEFFKTQPRPHLEASFVENVSGNFIFESRNVEESFLVRGGENLRWCFNTVSGVRDCQDFTAFGNGAELIYESASCGSNAYHLLFCDFCWGGSNNLMYCRFCASSSDCFGCISFKRKQYGVFNRLYSRSEYEALVEKIIEHMVETGEWGEFFPEHFSFFPYNHSYAQRLFPLGREEALKRGFSWHDRPAVSAKGAVSALDLPDGLPGSDEPMTVLSALSGRPFRIAAEEIKRYRSLRVPLPRLTYDERMLERSQWTDSYQLYERFCEKTGKKLLSHIDPCTPWVVWDREIYENEFFS